MFYKIKFQVLEKTEKKYELEIYDSIYHFIFSRSMGIVYDNFMHLLIDFCIISIQLYICCALNYHIIDVLSIHYENSLLDFYLLLLD